jgi:hypothetical protein
MNSTVYLVSGLPRSGTSLMMQMLHRGGLEPWTDRIRTADEDNPRGYFELEQVKQTSDDCSWIDQARGKVVKLISQLLMTLPAGGPYKVVFMRRDLDEVLASQHKMLERRGEADESTRDPHDMKQLFVAHLEDVEAWLRARADVDVLFVNYNRLLAEPRRAAERIDRFVGGVLDVDAMVAAVDPALYRNRKRRATAEPAASMAATEP